MYRSFLFLVLIVAYDLAVAVQGKSKYAFSLLDSPQRTTRPSGNISSVTVHEFPILRGLSRRYVSSPSSAIREPIGMPTRMNWVIVWSVLLVKNRDKIEYLFLSIII